MPPKATAHNSSIKALTSSMTLILLLATGCSQSSVEPLKEADKAAENIQLDTTLKKASYGVGFNISQKFRDQNITLDKEAFDMGMNDAALNKKTVISEEEINAAFGKLEKEIEEKTNARIEALAKKRDAEQQAQGMNLALTDGSLFCDDLKDMAKAARFQEMGDHILQAKMPSSCDFAPFDVKLKSTNTTMFPDIVQFISTTGVVAYTLGTNIRK